MNLQVKWMRWLAAGAVAFYVLDNPVAASSTNGPMLTIDFVMQPPGPQKPKPQIITAIWEDGRVVWSVPGAFKEAWRQPRDLKHAQHWGGPPFHQGRIAKEKLEELWRILDEERTVAEQTLTKEIRRQRVAPSDSGTTILLRRGGEAWKLQSRHEFLEYSGEFVMTAYTSEALNGRDREKVLAQQPLEYQKFRKLWSKVRQAVLAALPEKGEPFNGDIAAEVK